MKAVLDVLLTSSVLILALLLLRRLFRRAISRRVQYALWGLVLVRLLVPVNLPAFSLSVLNVEQETQTLVAESLEQHIHIQPAVSQTLPEEAPSGTQLDEQAHVSSGTQLIALDDILKAVWLMGMGVMTCWLAVSNLRFWRKLRKARTPYSVENCKHPVYLIDTGLPSPCLFGLFRPAIYLTPAAVSPERLRHVLAHEETHARHLDPLWSLLRCVCLAVYWFDPLVWAAAAVSKTDCELACDEGTLRRLGDAERIPYGQTLLSLIPVRTRPADTMLAATTMTAGKRQLKDRITRIAENRQTAAAALFAAAALVAVVCAATFTEANPPEAAASVPAIPIEYPEREPVLTLDAPESDGTEDLGSISASDEELAAAADVPDEVLSAAKEYVKDCMSRAQQDSGAYSIVGGPAEYDDWRIESLQYVYTYESFHDHEIAIYQLNYELHTTTPEKVVIASGSYITEDGWVCPTYPCCTYLFFSMDNGVPVYLYASMENDCSPGDELFTRDMEDNFSSRSLYTESLEPERETQPTEPQTESKPEVPDGTIDTDLLTEPVTKDMIRQRSYEETEVRLLQYGSYDEAYEQLVQRDAFYLDKELHGEGCTVVSWAYAGTPRGTAALLWVLYPDGAAAVLPLPPRSGSGSCDLAQDLTLSEDGLTLTYTASFDEDLVGGWTGADYWHLAGTYYYTYDVVNKTISLWIDET